MLLIGIDPDSDKSGVAISENGKLKELKLMRFFDLCNLFEELQPDKVYLEAGWLNPSSRHHPAVTKAMAAKIGMNVGMNHQTGKLLYERLRGLKIDVELIRPKSKKLKADTFNKLTGWNKRTNQETRDAAMLIFGRIK